MGKGGNYEREVARALSLWWTEGNRDDVFWRTATSGGMATVRRRRGKSTYGQFGDLQAVDPAGAPLMRMVSIELKRGYRDAHIADVLDCKPDREMRPLETFMVQAAKEARAAQVPFWLLIVRRDQREAMIYLPWKLYLELNQESVGPGLHCVLPWFCCKPVNAEYPSMKKVFGTTLKSFMDIVSPEAFRLMAESNWKLED